MRSHLPFAVAAAAALAGPVTCQIAWTVLPETPRRTEVRMVFDSIRQTLVAFGGTTDGRLDDDVLIESDGGPWRVVTPAGSSPSPRPGPALAFDIARGQSVVFGGVLGGNGPLTDETWTWDGAAWQLASGPAPTPRFAHAMAYDAARQRVVLFGGLTAGLISAGDTWEWDGTSWTQIHPPTSPLPRWGHSMTYDAARARVLLCGGATGAGETYIDTWEWDGTTWTERPAAVRPSRRYGAAVAYDPARARVVLHGGRTGTGVSDETWEWDGQSWARRPTIRRFAYAGHSLAFDARRGRVVMYGFSRPLVYDWDGSEWNVDGPRSGPPPANGARLLWDPVQRRTLMVGVASTDRNELWSFDGSAWTLVDVGYAQTGVAPRLVSDSGWVFDTRRGVCVLYGGDLSGTTDALMEFDGTRWRVMSTTGPGRRSGHLCVYDQARGRTVVFGGGGGSLFADDTWEWDGQSWHNAAPAHVPPARADAAFTYDPVRERVVMFGGRTVYGVLLDDTWEWDGVDWTWRRPGLSPSARADGAMTWDRARRRAVMIGGEGADDLVWEWDGATWSSRSAANPMSPPRERLAMSYDVEHGRVVAFGGFDRVTRSARGDTWMLAPTDPALVREFGTGCAGVAHRLAATTLPWLGETFRLTAEGYPAGAGVVLWIGFSDSSWSGGPLPTPLDAIGMTGCSLLVAPDVPLTMRGTTEPMVDLALPNDPVLVGGELFLQAFGTDVGANPLGVVATPGLAAQLGAL